MDYPSISIILSFYQRFDTFARTLISLSGLEYPSPIEFVFIDDRNEDRVEPKQMVDKFTQDNPNYSVMMLRNDVHNKNTNILYNWAFKESHNDFVIYCHQDIIISTKSILKIMLDHYIGNRVSIVPYYLTKSMTDIMDGVDWKTNPRLIETLPGFWTDKAVVNTTRVSANLLTLFTGQYRKDWEWFGLYRDNQEGYLWIDQDIAIREQCLHKDATSVPPNMACLYHQWHGGHVMTHAPGYRYKTEREARLLDLAEKVE